MSAQHHFAPGDQWDRDLYARERVPNSAIIAADISRGWEEYLEILDAFYADHVEVSDGTENGSVFGRERIRTVLFKFLSRFMSWLRLADCQYRFEKARFMVTPQMRHIRPGRRI